MSLHIAYGSLKVRSFAFWAFVELGKMCIHSSKNVLGTLGGVSGSSITACAINYPSLWAIFVSIFTNFICYLDKNHLEITFALWNCLENSVSWENSNNNLFLSRLYQIMWWEHSFNWHLRVAHLKTYHSSKNRSNLHCFKFLYIQFIPSSSSSDFPLKKLFYALKLISVIFVNKTILPLRTRIFFCYNMSCVVVNLFFSFNHDFTSTFNHTFVTILILRQAFNF